MKVFGIGLPRTGNMSLCEALRLCGFERAVHYTTARHRLWKYMERGGLSRLKRIADNLDVWTGLPCCMYGELYELYPDALFIITTREMSSWLDAVDHHLRHVRWRIMKTANRYGDGKRGPMIVQWAMRSIFGSMNPSQKRCAEAYVEHTGRCAESLLGLAAIDVIDGWAGLERCGIDVPDGVPFPWLNRRVR